MAGHYRTLSVIVATLATIALTGCGSTKPLTRAQLVSKANSLCSHVQAKMKAAGVAKTTQEYAKIAKKLAGFEQQQLESMRKLKPPPSMASDWKQMIEGAEEITEDAGTLSTDIQLKKDKAAGAVLQQIGAEEKKLAPIVQRDGFHSCSQLS
jgi:hypothetical protein